MSITMMIWILIGVMVFFLFVFLGYFIYWLKVFKYRFEIYENISGVGYEKAMIVRGRLLRIAGSLSEKVFWVPKLKEYLSAYGRKMGKNLYWFFRGQDGYLYNMVAGDLDAGKGMLDVEPVNRDVRSFHTTNQKNINERYTKPKNWPMVLMSFTIILTVIILIIGGYVIYGKLNEGLEIANANVQASTKATEAAANVLQGIENVLNTNPSGGIKDVGGK